MTHSYEYYSLKSEAKRARDKAKREAAQAARFDPTQWVGKAVNQTGDRPVMTWGHKMDMMGKSALVGTDGYHALISWDGIEKVEGDWIEYKKSVPFSDTFRYPYVEAIIPFRYNHEVIVHPNQLLQAVKQAMVFAKHSGNRVKFVAQPSRALGEVGIFTISAACNLKGFDWSLPQGDVSICLDCDYRESGFTFTLNGQYLLNALAGFKGFENVTIRSTGSNEMVAMGEIHHRLALIMPMRAE